MKLVVIESPLAGNFERNIRYARLCMLDCFFRKEAAIASHLLYPQILNDEVPALRTLGIEAGLLWAMKAELAVFYLDLRGFSEGMTAAWNRYVDAGIPREERRLPTHLMEQLDGPITPFLDIRPTPGFFPK